MKICTSCKQELPLSFFWPQKGTADGRHYWCNGCFKAAQIEKTEKIKAQTGELRKNPEKWDVLIRNTLYSNAKKRAKILGVDFTITRDDIPLVHECPILRVPLQKAIGVHERNSYSLDRRDSSQGYVPGNVFVLSQRANNIKSSFSIEEVERLLAYMKGNI